MTIVDDNKRDLLVEVDNDKYTFKYIQDIVPETENGQIKVYNHRDKYPEHEKNKYGNLDFCSFKIDYPNNVSGVYIWIVDREIIYIGETDDFAKRFNQGYGNITPYNCNKTGQTTNCKMNNVVLNLAKDNKVVKLYFYPTDNYKKIELQLLQVCDTQYNQKNN